MLTIVDDILIFLFSFYVVSHFSKVLISSTLDLAKILRLTSLFVSFLFIGIGTSIPEFSIAISSIITGRQEISFADLVGSNVVNSSLILGIGLLLFKGNVQESLKETRKKVYGLIIVSSLLPLLILNNFLTSKQLGIFLSLIFFFVSYFLAKEKYRKREEIEVSWKEILEKVVVSGVALFVIIFFSRFLVISLIRMSHSLKINLSVFSKIIIAFSTSLPELIAVIRAARSSQIDIIMGDVFGSNLANFGLLLSFLLFSTSFSAFTDYSFELFLIFFLNFIVLISFDKLQKSLGIILISIYLLYLFSNFPLFLTIFHF